jgi:MYXO-CTERM domain-containing protein
MKLILVAVVALATAGDAYGVPTIVNGDLEGAIADASVPPGWFLWQGTPDTVGPSGPFNNTPTLWMTSPNGGTFVRAGGSELPYSEALAQNVTGFSTGVSYQLDMFVTNLGFQHPTSGDWIGQDGFWTVYIDGVFMGATTPLSKPLLNTDGISWSLDSVTFVAPSGSFELALVPLSSAGILGAYMGIDGVSVREVPAPGPLALAGLASLGGLRRRQRM